MIARRLDLLTKQMSATQAVVKAHLWIKFLTDGEYSSVESLAVAQTTATPVMFDQMIELAGNGLILAPHFRNLLVGIVHRSLYVSRGESRLRNIETGMLRLISRRSAVYIPRHNSTHKPSQQIGSSYYAFLFSPDQD